MTQISIPATSKPSDIGRAQGFTLIELSVVLVIIGLLLAMALPRLPALEHTRMQAAGRRLATLVSYLHDEAALRGRVYRLSLDPDLNRYDVAMLAPFADGHIASEFTQAWDPYGRGAALPQGVSFAASGSTYIYFLPEGGGTESTIELIAQAGGGLRVTLDPVTGRTQIGDLQP
ncbi:MAG: GspH/FimT family pseudopilin [Deltaproteobacteria bacterium]